eukprot:Clim_evm59s146 gene=Clim_evmTU59s146
MKLLIVGAGPTGALLSHQLRRASSSAAVTLWDKGRGVGGRMSTSRSQKVEGNHVDLGAQYLTKHSDEHNELYDELLQAGAIKLLDSALIKGGNHKADECHYSSPTGITTGFERGRATMLAPYKINLERVEYSSRYAVGLHYTKDQQDIVDKAWGNDDAVRYYYEDDVIRYISYDNRKCQAAANSMVGPSICVHSSVPFGLQHLDMEFDTVKPLVMKSFDDLIPGMPEAAEVKDTQKDKRGLIVSQSPLVLVTGDAFTGGGGNFDGCARVAKYAAKEVQAVLKANL